MPLQFVFLAACYCAAIYVSSANPDPSLPDPGIPHIDKVYHAILFGGLCAIVSLGMRKAAAPPSCLAQWLAPIAFASAYGLSDEIHQAFVPGRTFDILDWTANTAGACAAQIVLCGWHWRIPIK